MGHGRSLPEHDCCKKFVVAGGVLIVGGGMGFTADVVALSGGRHPNGLGRSSPEQNKIYKADGLDLREARHKHSC